MPVVATPRHHHTLMLMPKAVKVAIPIRNQALHHRHHPPLKAVKVAMVVLATVAKEVPVAMAVRVESVVLVMAVPDMETLQLAPSTQLVATRNPVRPRLPLPQANDSSSVLQFPNPT